MKAADKIWMRKSDGQLGYAFTGCLGWVWFFGEWPESEVICSRTPCIFIDDPLEAHGLHTATDFEDLGLAYPDEEFE